MLYPREKVETEAESGIMGKDVDKGADNDDKEEEDKVRQSPPVCPQPVAHQQPQR